MLPFNLVAAVVVKKANIVYLSTQAVLDQLLTPSRAISNICFGVNCSLVSYSVGFKCRYCTATRPEFLAWRLSCGHGLVAWLIRFARRLVDGSRWRWYAKHKLKQWLQLRKLSTHCGHGHVFLAFWVREFADVVHELLLTAVLSWHATRR